MGWYFSVQALKLWGNGSFFSLLTAAVHYCFIHSKADICFLCTCVLSMQIPLNPFKAHAAPTPARCKGFTPSSALQTSDVVGCCSASQSWWLTHSHIASSTTFDPRLLNPEQRSCPTLVQLQGIRQRTSCLQYMETYALKTWTPSRCTTKCHCQWTTWSTQVSGYESLAMAYNRYRQKGFKFNLERKHYPVCYLQITAHPTHQATSALQSQYREQTNAWRHWLTGERGPTLRSNKLRCWRKFTRTQNILTSTSEKDWKLWRACPSPEFRFGSKTEGPSLAVKLVHQYPWTSLHLQLVISAKSRAECV